MGDFFSTDLTTMTTQILLVAAIQQMICQIIATVSFVMLTLAVWRMVRRPKSKKKKKGGKK